MDSTSDVDSETRWLRYLSRWALLTALMIAALVFSFIAVLGFDSSVPVEYAGLVQASRQPAAFRLASMLDIVLELMLGGLLVGFAGLLWRRAPIRATLMALCAAGQVANLIGAYIDLRTTSDLATRYATADPAEQMLLIETYRTMQVVHEASFNAGSVLYSLGFLLVASVGIALVWFPRWLAAWMALEAVFGIGERLFFIVTGSNVPFFPVDLLVNILGSLLLFLAIAAAFWRSPAPTARMAAATT